MSDKEPDDFEKKSNPIKAPNPNKQFQNGDPNEGPEYFVLPLLHDQTGLVRPARSLTPTVIARGFIQGYKPPNPAKLFSRGQQG